MVVMIKLCWNRRRRKKIDNLQVNHINLQWKIWIKNKEVIIATKKKGKNGLLKKNKVSDGQIKAKTLEIKNRMKISTVYCWVAVEI